MLSNKPKTINEYIALYPKDTQKKLREMHACIKKIVPKATESIKWSMPSLSYNTILVVFGAFKKHIGFYPGPGAIKALKKDLTKFKNAKGSIQFPLDKPLPLPLIRKLTKFRVSEYLKEGKTWKTK